MLSMATVVENYVLNLLDLLDLDEEVVDRRLKSLMVRKALSYKQLSNSLHLLQYKLLINTQEGTECTNEEELNFVTILLTELCEQNIEHVCKITNAVLRLNPSSLTCKAEHFLQQILPDLKIGTDIHQNNKQELEETAILKLKVCDSILDAALLCNEKLNILFQTPIEDLLTTSSDKLKNHFLMNTVPRLFNVVVACDADNRNILDYIWSYIQKDAEDKNNLALTVLVALSEFYLPTVDKDGEAKYESQIIFSSKFWQIILFGLNVTDLGYRKMALYLAKRAIECFVNVKCNATITSDEGLCIFQWDIAKETGSKAMWDSYFILIESFDEKQSNIVLPSLQLFDKVQSLPRDWLTITYNLGLSHSNIQVKQKCIEYRLKLRVTNIPEAKSLLEALNDINLYGNPVDIDSIAANMERMFQEDSNAAAQIFKAFPSVNWSPVPVYYTTKVLIKDSGRENNLRALSSNDSVGTVCDLLKVSCNNVLIRRKVHSEFLKLLTYFPNQTTEEQLMQIISVVHTHYDHEEYGEIIAKWLMNTEVGKKEDILRSISEKYYFYYDILVAILTEKIDLIDEVVKKIEELNSLINRQYSDKLECFQTAAYLMHLYHQESERSELKRIRKLIEDNLCTITRYILQLLLNENVPSEYERIFLNNHMFPLLAKAALDKDSKIVINQINKTSIAILMDQNSKLSRKIFCMTVLKISLNACQEEHHIQLRDFLEVTSSTKINTNEKGNFTYSRMLNKFYQELCELVHLIISKKLNVITNLENEMLSFIDNAIQCGGYGCLQWILKLMREILPEIIAKDHDYDFTQFMERMWREIIELKANQQYTMCIEEFINILFDSMLNATLRDSNIYPKIINTFHYYCEKIMQIGETSMKPLLMLARKIFATPMAADFGTVYLLDEILLYSPVTRKDQR